MNGVRTHTDCTGSCKSNYHAIMTMTAPLMSLEEAKYLRLKMGLSYGIINLSLYIIIHCAMIVFYRDLLWFYLWYILWYTLCYNCFLQRFIMVLSDHLASCESNGIDYSTPWYKWCIERLQQIFLIVSSDKVNIIDDLRMLW